ncbi:MULTISPECIES: serine hydrolase [Thermocrispum]|uniref:Serine hydrolase n=1 Tax=Thermocrispum agreste TaxID=37925 RepID=A0ABD6FJ05_9PSEU|nr:MULTISPECIES: serine hydrolase [Thermocrispum]
MTDALEASLPSAGDARWGVRVVDLDGGDVLVDHGADRRLSTASVGKIFLLLEVADRLASGALRTGHLVDRRAVEPVADSGLWQHLAADVLPVGDAAALVGAVSDNLATNVLLDLVGLAAVQQWPARLGLAETALHDKVRDVRRPSDPPALSTGTAAELAEVMRSLHAGEVRAARRVLGWLRLGTDLSMVGQAFNLDPLAHAEPDRGVRLINKTGTDTGVRADVGLVYGPRRRVAYAVVANWTPEGPADPHRDAVLAGMRQIGAHIRAVV